jgi:molybdopterin/thiamine biosynthesis adenylyltransferase
LAIGNKAQLVIGAAKTAVIGVGGVGAKASYDMALKGHGWIDLVDPGKLEKSNLSRIPLPLETVGKYKAEKLVEALQQLRPNLIAHAYTCTVERFPEHQFYKYDLLIVATDNLPSRRYCNQISLKHRVPSLQIGMSLENGRELISCRVVIPDDPNYPCYECYNTFKPEDLRFDYVYSSKARSDDEKLHYGVPKIVPSIVDLNSIAAGLAVNIAFKILTKTSKVPPYTYLDVQNGKFDTYWNTRNPSCDACSGITRASIDACSEGLPGDSLSGEGSVDSNE